MKKRFYLQFAWVALLLIAILPAMAQDDEATRCMEGYRIIEHAMGMTCVPETPQRVITLDTGETDNALALGANIVGAPVEDVLAYQDYLSDQLEGITSTGSISEPNLEAILALEPDLILGSKQRYEAVYDQLSQIAPTVFTESLRVPWQDNFLLHAEALNKTEEADELLAQYEANIADVQAALGDAIDNTTISIIRFRPGQVRLYLKSSYIGYILQDVGLPRPASQDEDVFSSEISLEEVDAVDADYIFITGYAEDDSDLDRFLESPLWQTLGGVQSGHAIDVNDDTWIAGLGVQAANLVLEDLKAILAPSSEEPAEEAGTDETASESITCEEGTKLVTHDLGESCVPLEPQRVVALDMAIMELMMVADMQPAASSELVSMTYALMHPELSEDFATFYGDAPDMGYPPNIEVILNVQPDLIIGPSDFFTESIYPELNAIAPTVLYEADPGNWRTRLIFAGEVLGLTDTVDEILADYDARVAELADVLGESAGETTVSLVRALPDQIGLVLTGTNAANVVASVGLARPESQSVDYDYVLSELDGRPELLISEEELALADADVVFVFSSTEDNGLTDNPLWNALPAVQDGRSHVVGYYWWGDSFISAHRMLDDLFEYVAGVEPENPNPFAEGLSE